MQSLLPEGYKRIGSLTAEKKWGHHFSHYKSMKIFTKSQGQLTPQSIVGSGRISNSSENLCMSLLPTSIKRIA